LESSAHLTPHPTKGLAPEMSPKDGKYPLPSEGNDRGICPLPHGTPCKGVEELPAPPLGLEKIGLELAKTWGMPIVDIPNEKSFETNDDDGVTLMG
jgi:hypothetical protein